MTNPKTLSDLEWSRVLDALEARCVSEAGKQRVRSLPLLEDPEELREILAQGHEAWDALMRGEPLPLHGIRALGDGLERLKMGATLGLSALQDLASVLGAARILRSYWGARRERFSALRAACPFDPSLDEIEEGLRGIFDHDGQLVDHASPRLRELRANFREARTQLISRLEELMRRHQELLQDHFWTEREGRYVLPVRSDVQRFPGIVHAASSSGVTLFVEPRSLIPQGNRLKVLEAEIRQEEEAICTRWSCTLAEKVQSISTVVDGLALADLRSAVARLAVDARLSFVDVATTPFLKLKDARHPLLVLEGVQAVGSDLMVEAGSTVVISGPNAGGKTVALKAAGLAALMLRAGLPLACDSGSQIGIFREILTDIGDEQSLARNLSTFSAHVTNLAHIVERAGDGTIVLLDEIASGTDPREGEALASAILDHLCERRAATFCTTHHEALKALAFSDDRFVNASVGVDLSTMNPNFRLVYGVPGGSVALSVARRFGIPEVVLERAERFLSSEVKEFDRILTQLNDERRALDLARAAAERIKTTFVDKQKELDAEIAQLRSRGRTAVDREAEALQAAIRRAREDLRVVQARLRAGKLPDERELKEMERTVNKVAAQGALGGEFETAARSLQEAPVAPAEGLHRGARVYVPRLRLEAEIVEIQGEQVRVAAGPLKLTVSAREIQSSREKSSVPKPTKAADVPRRSAVSKENIARTQENTCDLRGMRLDDAIRRAEQSVERALGKWPAIFLLHGQGTSTLREAVRGVLENHSSVAQVRPGTAQEGGESVTILYLR